MKKYILLKDLSKEADTGSIYIQGLNGVPTYYEKRGESNVNDWYWRESTKKEDCNFLHKNTVKSMLEAKELKKIT